MGLGAAPMSSSPLHWAQAQVAVGHPVLWELAAGGEDGVRQMLEMLRSELARLSHYADAACQGTLSETSYSFASGGTALAIVIVSRSQLPLPPLLTAARTGRLLHM